MDCPDLASSYDLIAFSWLRWNAVKLVFNNVDQKVTVSNRDNLLFFIDVVGACLSDRVRHIGRFVTAQNPPLSTVETFCRRSLNTKSFFGSR